MYNDLSKIEPPNPTITNPVNPVNLVNPVQNDSTARRHPAPKPNRSGSPLQINALDRTESESEADQKRTGPGSKVEKSFQPIANTPTQKPKSEKMGEPNEPTLSTPDPPSSTARLSFPFTICKWKSSGHFNILTIGTRKTSAISTFSVRGPKKPRHFNVSTG